METAPDLEALRERIASLEAANASLEAANASLEAANQELRRELAARERAEQEIAHAKTLLEALILQSPVPMALASHPDLIVRAYNEACLEVLGSDEREAVGKPLYAITQTWQDLSLDGAKLSLSEMPLGRALRGERTEKLRTRLLRADGSERVIETSGVPILDRDGNLIAGFIIFPDITESVRAEELLRAQHDLALALTGATSLEETLEHCLEALLRIAPADCGGIYLVDETSGDIDLAASRGLSAEFVATSAHYAGGSANATAILQGAPLYLSEAELAPLMTSDQLAEGLRMTAVLPVQHRGRVIAAINIGSHLHDSIPPQARFALEATASQVGSAIAHARANERLRRSEERYRSFVANASEGIYRIDFPEPIPLDLPDAELVARVEAGAVIGELNDALARRFGLPAGVLVGQPAVRFAPDGGERALQLIRAPDRKLANLETTDLDREGKPLFFIENSVAIVEEGRLVRIWGTKSDITERKRAEAERKRLEEQLGQSQKMEAIGRLAGGIAHDFNNLLTGINGYAEMLLAALAPGDPIRGDLEEIRRAGERASSLTSQLLAFSRKQVIAPRVIDPNEVIERARNLLRRIIGEDIELTVVAAERVGRIKADPSQLDQVLVNLAVNARDAMPGGGKLTIETANVRLDEAYCQAYEAKPGDYVMLAVTDTGCGMDAETRARVFEPFFTTKGKEHGTGLGLAMVYGIVQQHHGFINVYSEPGIGSSFKLYLPRVFLEPEPIGVAADPLARGNETVLLVEDEEVVRSLARRILERQGYTVLEAAEAASALLACSRHAGPIHLLLTDVVMPTTNGRELYGRLAALRPELKVLYMSGYTENVVAHHGVLEPGIEFLQKPFTIETLSRRVREVLDQR